MPYRCTVVSVALPTIRTHCRKCGVDRPFVCSERFRANGNGKLVDIWLLYRCTRCDATRNITVVERTPVHRVDRALLDAAYDNDAPTARRLARDVSMLRRAGVIVDAGDEWAVDSRPPPATVERMVLELPEPLLVRLDGVLAGTLGVNRRTARQAVRVVDDSGRLDTLRLWGTVEVCQLRQ